MKYLTIPLFALISIMTTSTVHADLKVGDSIVNFAANDDKGDLWTLQDHLGKKNVIVYFYPAAMTGGCTKQACSYRDAVTLKTTGNVLPRSQAFHQSSRALAAFVPN